MSGAGHFIFHNWLFSQLLRVLNMKSVLEKNKIAEKTGTINRSLNSTSNVTRQVTLPPINHIYQREPSTLAKPSGVPKLPL